MAELNVDKDSKESQEELEHPAHSKSGKPHTVGWVTIFLIFGLLGVWAVVAEIETSVQAGGKVIAQGYKKAIQHPSGGIVEKIYVSEGERVKLGDPIIGLDDTAVTSRLNGAIKQYDEMLVQKVRCEAESNLSDEADFESIADSFIEKERLQATIAREKALLQSNSEKLKMKLTLLDNKNSVLREQIEGLRRRIELDRKMLESHRKELEKWRSLFERNMTDELKLLERERKIDQIEAEIATTQSSIREKEGMILSNENQRKLAKIEFVDDARRQLKDIGTKLAMMKEQIKAYRNEKENLMIKAVDEGTITDMQIHVKGEVVPPQKPIAYVVPDKKSMIIEAYISPTDIDKVRKGQQADVKFASYVDPSALPVYGKVTYVSADTIERPEMKQSFYKALVEITPDGMKAIEKNGYDIVPGMPVTVFIKSGKRSFMSYILLPLESLFRGAFHAN
jgi:HlyD family type I secretion membrane fusion protein